MTQAEQEIVDDIRATNGVNYLFRHCLINRIRLKSRGQHCNCDGEVWFVKHFR